MDGKATLVASDLHYGDSGQLYHTLEECMGRAVARLAATKAKEREVVINGDAVAGKGVYRGQESQNAIQGGAEQVWFAARDIKRWQEVAKANRWVIIRGNHDHANKENLASQLVVSLKLLGIPSIYRARSYVGNFAPKGAPLCSYDAQHGFGASSYYANSYEGIRECWRLYIERAQKDEVLLARFLRAHTHWLNVGQVVGLGVAIDTTGGWHRQERDKLPSDTRNTGVLLYTHDGQALRIETIEAQRKLLLEETDDACLHYRTMAAAAEALTEMTAWAKCEGLA